MCKLNPFFCNNCQIMSYVRSIFELFFIWFFVWDPPACIANSLGIDIIHRYSEKGKELFNKYGHSTGPLPPKGSVEFHNLIHKHDKVRHGRKLTSSNQTLIFIQGNETTNLGPNFGWIHYALVDVGTPNKTFLVALDSGSDLFWVPCQCKQCSTTSPDEYSELKAVIGTLNEYTPSLSSTSSAVMCTDPLCDLVTQCKSLTGQCPYRVDYLSANTSTSGYLVKDVVHMADGSKSTVKPYITFGCGESQTGIFLTGGAPNGLLGLGMGDVSFPSLLAKNSYTQDSFSMCFNSDKSGRIVFGDAGVSGQRNTSFLANKNPAYFVGMEQIKVGSDIIQSNFRVLFDTGTSFTYLPTQVYNAVTSSFQSQIKLSPRNMQSNSDIYRFCYSVNTNQFEVPTIRLVFGGGADYVVSDPLLVVKDVKGNAVAVCLAIMQTDGMAILGQNFMMGYRITFNRAAKKLGWVQSDCYSMVLFNTSAGTSSSYSVDGDRASRSTNLKKPLSSILGLILWIGLTTLLFY